MRRINNHADVNLEDFQKLLSDKSVYPNLCSVLQTALADPVSSVTRKRSFFTMRRIETRLRTFTHQDRLSNLSSIHIERDISNNISTESILGEFSTKKKKKKFSFY